MQYNIRTMLSASSCCTHACMHTTRVQTCQRPTHMQSRHRMAWHGMSCDFLLAAVGPELQNAGSHVDHIVILGDPADFFICILLVILLLLYMCWNVIIAVNIAIGSILILIFFFTIIGDDIPIAVPLVMVVANRNIPPIGTITSATSSSSSTQ